MNTLLIVVGASGSGKTSLFPETIVTHTTRPARVGEVDGESYHFEDGFVSGSDVVGHGYYNGNHYWTTVEELNDGGVIIVEPSGVEEIVNAVSIPVVIVVVSAPEHIRLARMLERGDEPASAESRIATDREVFAGVEDLANVIIYNG